MPQNNWCDVTASARSPVRQSTYYTLHRQSRDAISDATRERVGAARAPHRHTHDGRGTEIPKKVTAALCTPRQLIHGRNERAGLHRLRGEDHREKAHGQESGGGDEHLAKARHLGTGQVVRREEIGQVILNAGLRGRPLEKLVTLALHSRRARPPVRANLKLQLALLLWRQRFRILECQSLILGGTRRFLLGATCDQTQNQVDPQTFASTKRAMMR